VASPQERVDLGLKATLEKVLAEDRRSGTPLTVVRDGKVVQVLVEEFEAHIRNSTHAKNGTPNGQ
jgi:hypothetical protein